MYCKITSTELALKYLSLKDLSVAPDLLTLVTTFLSYYLHCSC